MRISRIDLWHVKSPLVRPYHLSKFYGTLTHAEAVMLRLTTDGGLEGWGEADAQMGFTEEWTGGVLALLAQGIGPNLIGRDARDFARLIDELAHNIAGNPCARGAVDMALHDLAGKAAGVPVHMLLGGKLRNEIPVLWPLSSESLDASLEVVTAKVAEGYRTFMVKTGSRDVAEDAARCLALIERFPDVHFQADANQGWSEDEALRFVQLIGSAPLCLLEQPVPRTNPEGLARVHARALFPVSADEGVFSLNEAARLARMGAVDVFSIKPSKNGGLQPSRKIAALAEGHGLSILMNSMIEFGITQAAALHLGATLPNLMSCGHAYMSTLRLKGDPTDFATLVKDGTAHVPDRPGLGIAVDLQQVKNIAVAHHCIEADKAREAVA